jgi:hypothetical protein
MGIKTYNALSSIKQKLSESIALIEEIKQDDKAMFNFYELSNFEFDIRKSYHAFNALTKSYAVEIDTNKDDF